MLLALFQRASKVTTSQLCCACLHTSSGQPVPALILEDWQHGLRDQQLPQPVWECLLAIRHAGHDAYLVGGTVRDLLLHKAPRDYDLLTTATLQQCRRLLGGSIVGRRHPVCLVELSGAIVEASSLQAADGLPAAASHPRPLDAAALATLMNDTPAAVAAGHLASWASSIGWSYSQARRQDALRRDMTVNGLLYDPFSRLLLDYVGGWQDLQQQVVRCVGDPSSSFQADPTRMLRALRCASKTGFRLDPGTAAALERHKERLLTHTSPARLRQLLQRLLCHGRAASALQLLQEHGLMQLLLPVHHQYLQRCQQDREAPLLLPALLALDECFTSSRLQHVPAHVLLAVLVAPLMAQQLQTAARQLAHQSPTHPGTHGRQFNLPMKQPRHGRDLAAAVAAGEPLQGLLMELALTCIEQVVTSAPYTADGAQHPDHNALAVAHPEQAAGLLLAAWRHQTHAKQRPHAQQGRRHQGTMPELPTPNSLLPSVASPGATLLQALAPGGTGHPADLAAARKLLRRLARKQAHGEMLGSRVVSHEPDAAGLTCSVLDRAQLLLIALNKHAAS